MTQPSSLAEWSDLELSDRLSRLSVLCQLYSSILQEYPDAQPVRETLSDLEIDRQRMLEEIKRRNLKGD